VQIDITFPDMSGILHIDATKKNFSSETNIKIVKLKDLTSFPLQGSCHRHSDAENAIKSQEQT
jgi:hypothetical protein